MSFERLKAFCKTEKTAALIMSEENVKYYTGFSSSNGWLIVTAEKSVFLTDSRYIEAAKSEIDSVDEIEETKGFRATVVPMMKKLGASKISIEQSRTTVSRLNELEEAFDGIEIDSSKKLDNAIGADRRVKTDDEIKLIAEAQRIAERGFDHILGFIRPGLTEKEVQLELDYFMLKNGADGLSFETIAVAGANGSKPHGVPGDNVIKSGDFLTLDFGALYKGYHSDMTRTVAVGAPSDKQAEIYDIVLRAQLAGIAAIKPGAVCKEVDGASRKVIADAGYGEFFGHGFGHGVGIEIHENPFENTSSEEILEVGNVVTAEPGIYLPGQFGVRIEDMLLVTERGSRNFTTCEKKLIVL